MSEFRSFLPIVYTLPRVAMGEGGGGGGGGSCHDARLGIFGLSRVSPRNIDEDNQGKGMRVNN
mgnify:FL=1